MTHHVFFCARVGAEELNKGAHLARVPPGSCAEPGDAQDPPEPHAGRR